VLLKLLEGELVLQILVTGKRCQEGKWMHERGLRMSIKISTLLAKVHSVTNRQSAATILDFYEYMQDKGSENHTVNTIKVILELAGFLGPQGYESIKKREQILSFLNSKIKDSQQDPDMRWITTWNHYLNRIKLFYRWFYNAYALQEQATFLSY
jgi:hypothetical protein